MRAAGVPVRGEAGIGYVLDAGFDLPPLMFSPDEIEAVLVGTGKCSDADRERAESDPRMRFALDLAQALAPLLDDPAN